ncbi:hypothetical protein A3F37_02840 [Candidatus Saccharibacteria bacterium RIFCSPHIGHO2_12_FULL_41_12]|nr:MAG: hypothetical protein A3F37_02840 [Candidatus Saccharibacteria bacterium RIFCSPHIGHO2_12_FULL_41_12]
MFALVDCNNFFVSCERIFRPELVGKPVIVASSNDGCAVARSNEVKSLGIPMGAPVFKYKEIIASNKIIIFSGNFHLYGDISRRLTQFLSQQAPTIEVYSIDESFLDLSDMVIPDIKKWAENIVQRIFREIGVPVSIGIGPTKTLAKLASELAKKNPNNSGVVVTSAGDLSLEQVKVEDIWGIGRMNAPKFRVAGIDNALDIANSNRTKIRNIVGSVMGERLYLELSGIACYSVGTETKPQKVISATRTFGHDTSQAYIVESALADLAARACLNLRKDGQLTERVSIFVSSNRFKKGYSKISRSVRLDYPSANSGQIISLANNLFSQIYNPKTKYHRAGVILSELSPENNSLQVNLFDAQASIKQMSNNSLMKDVDTINKRFGRGKIHYATQDNSKDWLPRKKDASPAYTTHWEELPKIH